jgi:hypothetical protein
MHPLCCAACCHSISDIYTLVNECSQAMECNTLKLHHQNTVSNMVFRIYFLRN